MKEINWKNYHLLLKVKTICQLQKKKKIQKEYKKKTENLKLNSSISKNLEF